MDLEEQEPSDWFAQHAPTSPGGAASAGESDDWFAAHAPTDAKPSSPTLTDRALETGKDLAIGIAKGAGNTATNIGEAVRRIPGIGAITNRLGNDLGGRIARSLYGTASPPVDSDPAFAQAHEDLKPSNTTQHVGKVAEQIGESVLPGRAISSASTKLAAKIAPSLARYVGPTVAKIAPYAAGEAAGGAGVAAAQGNDPTTGAVLGGALSVAPTVASGTGARLMQSALKPGMRTLLRSVKSGQDVPPVVQTLLDEGVNVTPGGLSKLRQLLGDTNQQIDQAVAGAQGQVSPLRVASRLTDTAKKFGQQVNPQADLDAISDVGNNFLDSTGGNYLSVPEAQALKTGTYARIGDKYGKAGTASIEAEKGLARGLKEEIAYQVPEVGPLNAREGKLIEASEAVGKRVAQTGNRDPVGFAFVAHNPLGFLAAMIDRNPTAKSLLARGMYQGAAQAAKVDPQLVRTALQSVLESDESGKPPFGLQPAVR
jgi:hypothetical protein